MPSLLDTVKQNSAALASPAANPLLASATGLAPTVGEATEGIAGLTATAQTGKALGPGQTPKLSSLGERLASVNALNQAKDISKQAQLQGVSLDQQADQLQQQHSQAVTQLNEQQLDTHQAFNQQVKGLLFDQQNQLKQLDLSRDKARMEQAGFMLRLGNQQYTDKLQMEGQRARLDNAAAFNEALQRSVFADELDLLSNSLDFRNYMMADTRDAQRQLGEMDIEFAIQIAASEAKAANSQMMWSGVGNLLSAGLQYAAGQKPSQGPAPTGNIPQTSGISQPGPLSVPTTAIG